MRECPGVEVTAVFGGERGGEGEGATFPPPLPQLLQVAYLGSLKYQSGANLHLPWPMCCPILTPLP